MSNTESMSEKRSIIVVGKTGAGKSKVLNDLIGENVFKSSIDVESCTDIVKPSDWTTRSQNLFNISLGCCTCKCAVCCANSHSKLSKASNELTPVFRCLWAPVSRCLWAPVFRCLWAPSFLFKT